ncbi:MAG: hypothetical protein MZV64_70495, partial [Ignavibacteriales bacterium]|nr:hypothetical protein [Ignavibacteriales bacterium]
YALLRLTQRHRQLSSAPLHPQSQPDIPVEHLNCRNLAHQQSEQLCLNGHRSVNIGHNFANTVLASSE